MAQQIFDVAINGAGVCGAAGARALCAYSIGVAVLKKQKDAGFGVSKANSGIVMQDCIATPPR